MKKGTFFDVRGSSTLILKNKPPLPEMQILPIGVHACKCFNINEDYELRGKAFYRFLNVNMGI